MRELFLAKLKLLGFDATKFSLHSLRSGGATAAANAGVADRLFKRHGRWRSETAKDGYVKDSCTRHYDFVTLSVLVSFARPQVDGHAIP